MNEPDEADSPRARKTEAEARRERLAAQLRANLKRRKAQSKARRSHDEASGASEDAGVKDGNE